MKKQFIIIAIILLNVSSLISQLDTSKGTFWNPIPRNYEVKQAIELESLFPMFFSGGFHLGVAYRYESFRIRVSVINSGTYDAEPAGLNNSSNDYKRYYKTSPGFFFGYNIWKNLELYTYLELHTFEIEQKSTGFKRDIKSTDIGGGISYQFFVGRHFYIQPGFHIYLRGDNTTNFNGNIYNISNVDLSTVIRIGYRLWSDF